MKEIKKEKEVDMSSMKVEILCQNELTSKDILDALVTQFPRNSIYNVYIIDKWTENFRKLFNRFLHYLVFLGLVFYAAFVAGQDYGYKNKSFSVELYRQDKATGQLTPIGSTMVSPNNNKIAINE